MDLFVGFAKHFLPNYTGTSTNASLSINPLMKVILSLHRIDGFYWLHTVLARSYALMAQKGIEGGKSRKLTFSNNDICLGLNSRNTAYSFVFSVHSGSEYRLNVNRFLHF